MRTNSKDADLYTPMKKMDKKKWIDVMLKEMHTFYKKLNDDILGC